MLRRFSPRLLVRLRKSLRRINAASPAPRKPAPVDPAWRELLQRLDAEETERRLSAMEDALNGRARDS